MKDTINILQVVGGMNMNGAETFIMNVYRNIDRKKYRFFFLCYGEEGFDYENEINELGGVIVRIKKRSPLMIFSQINDIRRAIKANHINVLHAHTYCNSVYSVIAAKQERLNKIIVHSHSTHEIKKRFLRKIYENISKKIIDKYSTTRIACSEEAGKSLFRRNFLVINNAVDLEKNKYSAKSRALIRKEFGLEDKSIIIGHVGRFHAVKNHEFLLKALKNIGDDSYKLLMVGDGELMPRIKQLADNLGLGNQVIFTGKRADANLMYSAMDIFAFPSLYEGIPLAMIEAQANGLPIIASDRIDRASDLEGKTHFIPIDNVYDWANAIKKFSRARYRPVHIYQTTYSIKRTIALVQNLYSEYNKKGTKG